MANDIAHPRASLEVVDNESHRITIEGFEMRITLDTGKVIRMVMDDKNAGEWNEAVEHAYEEGKREEKILAEAKKRLAQISLPGVDSDQG